MDYKQSDFDSLIAAVISARDCVLSISSLPLQDRIRNHKAGEKAPQLSQSTVNVNLNSHHSSVMASMGEIPFRM